MKQAEAIGHAFLWTFACFVGLQWPAMLPIAIVLFFVWIVCSG